MVKYNCGSGERPKKWYINVDYYVKADIKYDLNKYPYKFAKNNSAEEIVCERLIGMINNIPRFLQECHRILKPNGRLIILDHHFSNVSSIQSVIRIHRFGYRSFNPKFFYIPILNKFETIEIKMEFMSRFFNIFKFIPIIYEYTILKYLFPCNNITFVLKKRDERKKRV